MPEHVSAQQLQAGLEQILASPADAGELQLIVARPQVDQRSELAQGYLDPAEGLQGDDWRLRGPNPDPDLQITLMNSRVAELVAGERARWSLAGDQLYVDMDLSWDNLPAGTRLQLGEAILQVSAEPHTGCAKFVERFGRAAMVFVNSTRGRALNLRGINARVIQSGAIRVGDVLRKLSA